MADVLMFTPFAPARLGAALLIRLDRLGIQLANEVGLGVKVRVVAIQPVFTPVGLEVNVVQDTPET
jgi:hypothetical protein